MISVIEHNNPVTDISQWKKVIENHVVKHGVEWKKVTTLKVDTTS